MAKFFAATAGVLLLKSVLAVFMARTGEEAAVLTAFDNTLAE